MLFAVPARFRFVLTLLRRRSTARRQRPRFDVLSYDFVERLEDRRLLDMTLFNQSRQLVELKSDAVATAVPVNVLVNGTFVGTGDQLVMSYDVDAGPGFDYRQRLVLDSNGLLRVKHTDSDMPAGSEDKFGTSVKLPPGIIVDGPQFFLTSKVEQIDLLTDQADAGILKLHMFGRPANGPGTSNPSTLPVSIEWTMTIQPPTANTFVADLQTSVFFERNVNLSFNHLLSAEAFRVAEFSSSNVPADHTSLNVRTHDADQLRLCSNTGTTLATVDLNAATPNALLNPSSSTTARCMELNQVTPAPLNQDPPNVSLEVLPDNATYRGQGFITVDGTINENSDNVGAWLAREFVSPSIQAGQRIDFTVRIGAADYLVDPTLFTERVYRAYNQNTDDHFFTTNAAEFSYLVSIGLKDESTGHDTFAYTKTQADGTVAVHRLYNIANGGHYYTTNNSERDTLVALGWTFEKDEGFVFDSPTLCAREIFRLYNKNSGHHLFTDNPSVRDAILTKYPGVWVQQKSLGWSVPFVPPPSSGTSAPATRAARSAEPIPGSVLAHSNVASADESSMNTPVPLFVVSPVTTQLAGRINPAATVFDSSVALPKRSTVEFSSSFVIPSGNKSLSQPSGDVSPIDATWRDWGREGFWLDELLPAALTSHS